MAYSIPLGTADRLTLLFSYPNGPNISETLAKTIEYWFAQTLSRDGMTSSGASAAVRVDGGAYYLDLDGPPLVARRFPEYGTRLTQFLDNGWDALTNVVPQLVAEGKWDPQKTNAWRFHAGAQIDKATGSGVGCGKILPGKCAEAKATMIQDLIVARRQLQMADDPTRDPQAVLAECTRYWHDDNRSDIVCTLVQHQGSLRYPNPPLLEYRFDMSPKHASAVCKAHKKDPCPP